MSSNRVLAHVPRVQRIEHQPQQVFLFLHLYYTRTRRLELQVSYRIIGLKVRSKGNAISRI